MTGFGAVDDGQGGVTRREGRRGRGEANRCRAATLVDDGVRRAPESPPPVIVTTGAVTLGPVT